MSVGEDREWLMAERRRSQRLVQFTLAIMALGSLVFGLTAYMLADHLGLSPDTARVIASAFLIAAIADALVLYLWERIFR